MKTALITGIRGQDGAYLAQMLLEKGYRVIGADRRSGGGDYWRLDSMGLRDQIELEYMDLLEPYNIERVLKKYKPSEIYNLAAQSFVQVSFDQPLLTMEVNGHGTLRLLEAVRNCSPKSKFYQASTSELFGKVAETPQKESTPFHPRSPYGVAKLAAHWATINYREAFGLFACCGILFNHESPLRGPEFVTRKITQQVAEIAFGKRDKITLGNLNAKRDWGFAGDYVVAMWKMLQQDEPDDFVIATGETHSIREFVDLAFASAGIEIFWFDDKALNKEGKVVVDTDPRFNRAAEVDLLLGDPSKAREKLDWKARMDFPSLVAAMVNADMKCLEMKGVA